jgi:hypothetical protein
MTDRNSNNPRTAKMTTQSLKAQELRLPHLPNGRMLIGTQQSIAPVHPCALHAELVGGRDIGAEIHSENYVMLHTDGYPPQPKT